MIAKLHLDTRMPGRPDGEAHSVGRKSGTQHLSSDGAAQTQSVCHSAARATMPRMVSKVEARPSGAVGVNLTRLRVALWVGAAVWLLLLLAGFFAPGGWTWGMPGPVGHMENYVISLWLVALVLAPIIAALDRELQSGALLIYLLGIAAILVSTIRGEPPKLISDAPPWIAALLSGGLDRKSV